ncbi:MAG: hypothetical protein LBN12_00410 [Clostridiales Family XIII bacterium]|jgi:hypothetical protein|nr:hypothetical protein [Clostridiales Family XIII bacterium]
MSESKYLQNYDEYVASHPDEVSPAWEGYYKAVMENEERQVFNMVLQYIFM